MTTDTHTESCDDAVAHTGPEDADPYPLYTQVSAALQARRGEWMRIASECNIAYATLHRLANRRTVKPDHLKLVLLAKHMELPNLDAAA